MGLSLLKLPTAPDSKDRNWSTAYLYNEYNSPIRVDFYNEVGLNNALTLNVTGAKYGYIHYHLPKYPYSQEDFKLYLLNDTSDASALDSTKCFASQWYGLSESPIRPRQQLTETTAASGLEEIHYELSGDGNELHTSSELLFLELQWH